MTSSAFDKLRQALQDVLNQCGDGYMLAHYVIVMGIQRMDGDGRVVSSSWVAAPEDQADYVTDGLLAAAEEMRAGAEFEDGS